MRPGDQTLIRSVVMEATRSARSQPVASLITVAIVMGMILAVLLTTGRAVGAEQRVLKSIDSLGSRSITILADPAAGITTDLLARVRNIAGIEWIGAFASPVDARNAMVPDGVPVASRVVYTNDNTLLGLPRTETLPGQDAWGSHAALQRLGFLDGSGAISLTTGDTYGVAGELKTPEFLKDLEPLILLPRVAGAPVPVNMVVVIARNPALVAPVNRAVQSVLAAEDPTKIRTQNGEALVELRGAIATQLGSFSRALVLVLVGVSGSLVMVLLFGLVMMRRKDFGRRRALGATRTFVVSLLLIQTTLLTCLGVAVGIIVATIALLASGDPLPDTPFTVALAVLTLVVALLAALLPAIYASNRQPLQELRVA